MAIKLEMLRCFAAVAAHGSLADAAKSLHRTPSAVSMMLKQFEDHIGVPLFESARKSRLTPVGELIYNEARREVRSFENTLQVIEGLARSDLGYLRLAVTPSVATTFLPDIISRFIASHPNVQIDLRDMDSASIAADLRQERADIGIGTLDPIDTLPRRHIFSDRFGVLCQRDSTLARDWDKLTWSDMHGQPFIANGLCALIDDPDFTPILESSRLMVPSLSSLFALVRRGVGVTALPEYAASSAPNDLVFRRLVDTSAMRHVHMITQSEATLPPAARAFADLICREIQ